MKKLFGRGTSNLDSFRKLLEKAVTQVSVILGEGTSDIAKILEEAPGAPIDPSKLEETHSSRDVTELSALDAIYALGGFTAFSFNNEGILYNPSRLEVTLPDKYGLTLRSGSLFERGLTDFWREANTALRRAQKLLRDFKC